MKDSIIKLGKGVNIDREKLLQSRMVILANSGAGKSYAIRKFAEEAVSDTQVIIIDPEGEFASLREKYDFILAGKNADVPVEIRSAALLATKLLELGKSAIIDLYELHPSERQRYVKLFFDAMINAPKELYHPVFIVLDEAHEYAPEGKPSEATWAVEAMASKGRKRGFCLIPASQRVSKLSKNVSAECNNKLIGRASQDLDYKRAADELGFGKDRHMEIKQLKPGEFFAFGPAISDEVVKVQIGAVHTTHAKVGYKTKSKLPPPSHIIKKILGELADLPQEAEKEAKTVIELKKENKDLKIKIKDFAHGNSVLLETTIKPEDIKKIVLDTEKRMQDEFWKERDEWLEQIQNWFKILENIGKTMKEFTSTKDKKISVYKNTYKYIPKIIKPLDKGFMSPGIIIPPDNRPLQFAKHDDGFQKRTIGKCAQTIASYLYQVEGVKSKTQVAVATGYSVSSGGFNNAISELSSLYIIERVAGGLKRTNEILAPELTVDVDTSLEKWLPKLGACARKIWELMLSHHPDETWEKSQIANETGYSVTSGGFNNSLSELSALGLIERLPGGLVRINPEVLHL